MTGLDDLFQKVSGGMAAYANSPEDADRTALLKDVATALVDSRGHFFNREGAPDWAGRTHAYRMWVRDATAAANLTPADRTSIQAAVRWHVGTALRERLSPEQLEAIGLKVKSPRERNIEQRANRAEVLALFGPGPEITSLDDLLTVAELFDVTLKRIPVGVLDTFTPSERTRLVDVLAPIDKRFSQIMRRVRHA